MGDMGSIFGEAGLSSGQIKKSGALTAGTAHFDSIAVSGGIRK
jgi:hypothetical protein